MHLVGLSQVEGFLSGSTQRDAADAVRAFIAELKYRNWKNARQMARDFSEASFEVGQPKVRYRLFERKINIDCWIDFATKTVLIESCRWSKQAASKLSKIKDAAR